VFEIIRHTRNHKVIHARWPSHLTKTLRNCERHTPCTNTCQLVPQRLQSFRDGLSHKPNRTTAELRFAHTSNERRHLARFRQTTTLILHFTKYCQHTLKCPGVRRPVFDSSSHRRWSPECYLRQSSSPHYTTTPFLE
jgi:hypothetical protein